MDLWIVGQYVSGERGSVVWQLSGVFDSKEKAVSACRTWEYFVGSVTLNQQFPHETVPWEGCYYPILKEGE